MLGEKALVLLSGGQDSTTCLFWAKQNFNAVFAMAFNYGQRHSMELKAAVSIAEKTGVHLSVYSIDLLGQLTENALTNHAAVVERKKPEGRPPNTLVEGRNMLFLTYAAVRAKALNIQHLVTGVGQADYSGYPDCRDEFIKSINHTLNLSMDFEFTIQTPLMWKDKSEIWQLADEMGVLDIIKNETVTCYNGIKGSGCGQCPACELRNNGLQKYLKQKNHERA
ncbi:MAG: 7-cyano-7-deazaguanine synthase QueC [Bacteroidota bacterium]